MSQVSYLSSSAILVSKSNLYWNPEHPPPSTTTLKNWPFSQISFKRFMQFSVRITSCLAGDEQKRDSSKGIALCPNLGNNSLINEIWRFCKYKIRFIENYLKLERISFLNKVFKIVIIFRIKFSTICKYNLTDIRFSTKFWRFTDRHSPYVILRLCTFTIFE